MEVWWAGFSIHPWRLAAAVLATLVLLLGYNRYAGLRSDASIAEVAIDSIEELGIGLAIAVLMLWLLGRISADMPANEIAGKVIVEALVVAIGVSVGTAQLGSDSDEDSGMDDDNQDGDGAPAADASASAPSVIGQAVLALCGAVLIAANVAPTEEIMLLAVEISPWRLLGLALVSLCLTLLILFFSDFRGAQHTAAPDGILGVVAGAVISYAIALAASAALLWFFGSFDGFSFSIRLAQTVVLGVAAALGASAGRLLLQASNQG
jgi:putative integral membrane protein (TIGR02587 family)